LIEEEVFDALRNLVNDRCYPMQIPQNAPTPAIAFSRVASTPQNRLEGGASIDQVRIQVDLYETTYKKAKELAALVRAAMEGASFKGTLQSDEDFYEPDVKYYRVSMDFYTWERG
jgi:hypothetical protein